jgi:CheY-like chemotaxis protein
MNGKTILLIDDDELLCDLFTNLLELEGYQVVQAANGQEGLAELAKRKYDLILLDLLMPLMDGIVFLRQMPSQMDRVPPVLVISASASGAVLDQLTFPAVAGVLRKPVSSSELLKQVASALAISKD